MEFRRTYMTGFSLFLKHVNIKEPNSRKKGQFMKAASSKWKALDSLSQNRFKSEAKFINNNSKKYHKPITGFSMFISSESQKGKEIDLKKFATKYKDLPPPEKEKYVNMAAQRLKLKFEKNEQVSGQQIFLMEKAKYIPVETDFHLGLQSLRMQWLNMDDKMKNEFNSKAAMQKYITD
eukprot:NODE_22_length_42145_cov_1.310612.p28 type:complete len:178 gc:universal NODE_22_length_42145_cov_1.310612:33146-32613(-)